MYPISPASAGFRSPYPTSIPITSSSLPRSVLTIMNYVAIVVILQSLLRYVLLHFYFALNLIANITEVCCLCCSDLYRFSPSGLMHPHPGLSPHAHALASHALVSSAPKADHSTLDHNHR